MREGIAQIVNKWDPIDLFPMAPKDEYSREIQLIKNIIKDNIQITEEELALEICQVFSKRFGSDVFTYKIEDCLQIADLILKL
ncbi:DUF1871 family protein [Anaeromicropila herbilytica]|uniref:DUF1871 domain-containing protein n=1 Tax=Anaeromicropila herbilytica TaxID=2785025 RepID=A0A7R7EIR9_9FIRM|nr:DUF1871 family protein [Anaeromicropila herbilytica]BCN29446.1 hypothetical protein bsdtb5_07410 [Anaeromicropila herbilytica]